jgi:hypothetical protein
MMRTVVLCWFLLKAAPSVAPRATPTPSATPVIPPAALAELAPFEGQWVCEAVGAASAIGPRSHLSIKRDLRGFWYSGRSVPERAADSTRLFFWGYDAVLGKFIGGWLDDAGGWSTPTSMGWEDDKLVFLGHVTATGEKISARETFTRPAEDAFRRTYEVLGFSSWRLVTDERCRRE